MFWGFKQQELLKKIIDFYSPWQLYRFFSSSTDAFVSLWSLMKIQRLCSLELHFPVDNTKLQCNKIWLPMHVIRKSSACYIINITISKILCLLKLRYKDNGMPLFRFVLLSLVLTLAQISTVLINKDFPNFCSKDIETDFLNLFLRLSWGLWAGYCLQSYRFLYMKSLVFYGLIIF